MSDTRTSKELTTVERLLRRFRDREIRFDRSHIESLFNEAARLQLERNAYRILAGFGLSGTDEADELAALSPADRNRTALDRIRERGLASMKAAADAARAAPEPPAEPIGYLHKIVEPDGPLNVMYSAYSDNPWSHWVKKHADQCKYECTPLYARPAPPQADEPAASPLEMARRFHETYERLAPQYGYTTRPETREFRAHSDNGRLMIAACAEIIAAYRLGPPPPAVLEPAYHTLPQDIIDRVNYVRIWFANQGIKHWCVAGVTNTEPRVTQPPGALPYQAAVLQWAVDSFGSVALNRDERAARLAEEAIEVAQAEGVALPVIQRIAERVYSRPVGELGREIGGVGITVLSLAANAGRDFIADTLSEWQRVLSKPRDWWTKKHAEKVAAGTADLSPALTKEV